MFPPAQATKIESERATQKPLMQRYENQPEPPASNASSMPTWDERIFALLPSGVDPTLIAENLRLSPSQRLDKLTSLLRFVEEARERRERLAHSL